MKKFFQVAGNRPTFRATCKDQDLTVIDLTGSTVTLFWRVDGSSPVSSAVMTIDNATQNALMLEIDQKGRKLEEVIAEWIDANEATWGPWVKAAKAAMSS